MRLMTARKWRSMGCVMFADKPLFRVRLGLRLLMATAAAALLTGCSDATRLSSNPFSNPFETASSGPVDRAPTGTIAPRAPSSSSTKIESRPLAPPSGASSLPAPVTTPQPVAPQAAAVIHTDFEKGFIRAETIGYDDFIKYRGEAGARDVGRLRLEGKEYRVQEGDVLHFRFNV